MGTAMSNCRKESEDLFVFIPDDILLDILKRLPDAILGYKAKYVCRRWMDLISNRMSVHCASLILQKPRELTAHRVDIREEGEDQGLQVKVQDLDIPRIGTIRSWSNEFLLMSTNNRGNKRCLYVYNLITKEGSYLPECNGSCEGDCNLKCGVALSFDVSKGIYKVVHVFMGRPMEYHILVLEGDIVSSNWKKIQVPCMGGGLLYSENPVSIQGRYIHWKVYWSVYYNMSLVSIDMVKEEIINISSPLPLPLFGDPMVSNYTIFEMVGSLALIAGDNMDRAEIWILKDIHRNKWFKLQAVTPEIWIYRRFPMSGVISNNKYIIEISKSYMDMWYYDLRNGAKKKLDIHIHFGDRCVVNSSPPNF